MNAGAGAVDDQLVGLLVDRARSEGLHLTGEGGLLQQLTKRVLESALESEMRCLEVPGQGANRVALVLTADAWQAFIEHVKG